MPSSKILKSNIFYETHFIPGTLYGDIEPGWYWEVSLKDSEKGYISQRQGPFEFFNQTWDSLQETLIKNVKDEIWSTNT